MGWSVTCGKGQKWPDDHNLCYKWTINQKIDMEDMWDVQKLPLRTLNLNLGCYGDSVTRWIIFWKFKLFNQYFLFMRSWFPKFFKSFLLPYAIINVLFASLKLLTNIPLSGIGRCSPLSTLYWLQGKCASRFPVRFYKITGGFLYTFSVSISPL